MTLSYKSTLFCTFVFCKTGLPSSHSLPVNPAMHEQPTGSGTQNDFPMQLPLFEHTMEQKAPQLLSPQALE